MLIALARLFLLLLLAVLGFVLVAYKGPDEPQQVHFRQAPAQYHTVQMGYELDFIELDDRGNLVQPMQAQSMLSDLDDNLAQSGTVVVLYVHGWKHNARGSDGDVACFAAMLQTTAATQRRWGHRVHGVYLGWPGVVYDDPTLQHLSFLGRKSAADRVGEGGHMLWLLAQIRALRASHAGHALKVVVVAHGLGARLLYRTLEEAGSRGVTDLTDLAVLVNPAITRAQARPPWMVSSDRRAPHWVIATSERDEVLSHEFFWAQTLMELLRGDFDRQHWDSLQAVGLGDALVTHDLRLQTPYTPALGQQSCQAQQRQRGEDAANYWLIDKVDAQGQPLYSAELVARQRVMDPSVMVVKVDGQIIPDHGTIFTAPFVDFVSRLLNYALERVVH